MRIRSQSIILIDCLSGEGDVATVSELGQMLGYEVTVRDSREVPPTSWPEALLTRHDQTWAEQDLAAQVLLSAVASGVSTADVLAGVGRALEKLGFDLGKPVRRFEVGASPKPAADGAAAE